LPIPLWAAILPALIAAATTYALVPQVRKFAIESRVADKPNGRKLHAHAIPHLGGVAIFSGFFLGLLVSLGSPGGALQGDRILALLPALLILFGLGLVDDLRGLRAGVKLTYQIAGALCAVGMGAGFHLQGAGPDLLPFLALTGFSVLWYVGVCNSMNLIDGLDGLAAGTASLAALGFLVVAVRIGEPAVAVIATCLIGALLAFLRFNFHPARIFMGDTGSMFLGFALASLGCILARSLGFWTAVLGSAAILGLPILDTASAIVRRVAARRHIFEADGEHTHHRLMRAGLSHRGAVLALYVLEAIFVLLGCGVLLGQRNLFFGAVLLGIVAALGVSYAARRVAVAPAPALRAVPSRAAPVRLPRRGGVPATTPDRAPAAADEVFVNLPPAAAGPS
jgi:UDP-GlcNAc:undecaprenyl-phosphate/decaprenyl-phosphate GlcNAc-1-phosphate transferase